MTRLALAANKPLPNSASGSDVQVWHQRSAIAETARVVCAGIPIHGRHARDSSCGGGSWTTRSRLADSVVVVSTRQGLESIDGATRQRLAAAARPAG